ncbi:hypothetical protein JMA_39600 (plasmid) [Jeotgalibacillus malaysiensis]|uniref:Uncharacterized protein n=1 Tax=Jeotgalibacillus malaysiensis TaxID=1508404 RepID=A0A0B5AXJ4_9BACL|nr:hypothetical protein [Jeotgalibacillus malaysiensis]AJD93278.1 hypothetical protein JMA_39600 [Jeotgalibacillus malaysiensis]
MKKSERILELMVALQKELESLPKEMSELSDKISDYDTVNSEMYHTLLSFNPSASESAKFVKNWQKALRERLEVKKEFQRLKTLQGQLNSLLKNVSATGSNLKKRILAKGNPFTYKTEVGMKIIEDSFHNFEGRVTYPVVFRGRKAGNGNKEAQKSKVQPIQTVPATPTVLDKKTMGTSQSSLPSEEVLKNISTCHLDSYNGNIYLLTKDFVIDRFSSWEDLVSYLNKSPIRSLFIDRKTRHEMQSEIAKALKLSEGNPETKNTLKKMFEKNQLKSSDARKNKIRLFEELHSFPLGKYQLPGQSDQQKKSS